MFEKLLATLPYNPGLANQVAFYGRRMREESTIRRTGLIFIVLAFMIQFFAVLNPPKPAAAASSNDLVYGGISGPQEAANKCNANIRGYGAIMAYYGIDCSVLASAQTTTIYARGSNGQLFSMGNNAYGKPSETPVAINGGNTVFWRHLYDWNFGGQPIKVLSFGAHGQHFYIIYDCGNLVSIGIPQKYTPPGNGGIGNNQPVTNPQAGIGPAKPVSKPVTPTPVPIPPSPPPPPNTPPPPPTPCPYDSTITADNNSCKPCVESTNGQDAAACVTIHKSASNITGGIADANNTVANPGDVITYTLYAKNNGKATVKDFVFQELLSDVLDYAGVTDLHGGIIDNNGTVNWPALNIKAGETVTKQITVTVKNPVPATPVGQSDPARFDLNMNNVYGNAINIKLPGNPEKTVEAAAATLPNTGPGTNLFIGSVIVIAAGYFFSRSRLLAKEATIALKESTAGA